MSDFSAVTNQRIAMLRNGYRPVPIRDGLKFPTMDNWQRFTAISVEADLAAWPRLYPDHGGTGVLCGAVSGVDIDVSDAALVAQIETAAMAILGMSPLRRVGRAPRVLLPYRAANPKSRWMKTPKLWVAGEQMHVEVRAAGMQFVAFGIHPDTARPYAWGGPSPVDTPLDALPCVTDDELREFLNECESILRAAGAVGTETGVKGGSSNSADKTAAALAAPDAETVIRLLDALPNPIENDRSRYVEVMLAAKGCVDGLEAVGKPVDGIAEAAIRWAARWPASPGEDAEGAKWDGDFSMRGALLAGWDNLEHRAKQDIVGYATQAAATEFAAHPVPDEPVDPDAWRSILQRSKAPKGEKEGAPKANLLNATIAFDHAPHWRGRLAWDDFSSRPRHDGKYLDDKDSLTAAVWLQEQGLQIEKRTAWDGLVCVAHKHRFHPVRDWLNGLTWDGTPRCDAWLIDHAGAADTPLNREFARKWLVSIVARAMRPGCQVDTMLILEGPQGLRKSSLFRALVADQEWFTDSLRDFENKDTQIKLQGKLIIEFADLAGFRRSDVDSVKAFLTHTQDTYRDPYGICANDHPRQCVFGGTVNPGGNGYLKDDTGARRFWTVECGVGWEPNRRIDTGPIVEARDQLFGEAVSLFRAGATWYLDNPEMEAAQQAEADKRYDSDPWEPLIAAYLKDKHKVSGNELMEMSGPVPLQVKDRSQAAYYRIGRAMRTLKWTKRTVRLDGEPVAGYVSPEYAATNGRCAVVPLHPAESSLAALAG